MSEIATNKVFPLAEIEALDFAEIIDSLSPIKVGIIRGCGLAKSTSAGYVHVNPGQVLIQGRLITVRGGDIFLPVPATEDTYYILVVCDLAATTAASSADVIATKDLTGDGRAAPPVWDFNVASKKTYAILGQASRNQSGVTTVTFTNRSPDVINAGADTRAIATTANARSSQNSTTIANNKTELTAQITTVNNRVTTVNNKVNAIKGLKSCHLVGQTVFIASLAAGSSIGVTCFVKAGETRYPASNASSASAKEKERWQWNQNLQNMATTLWQDDYSKGKLETFAGLGEFVVAGTNASGICLCGWNCVTGSTSNKAQYASLYIRNTGTKAASNITITVKGLFFLETTLN